MSDFRPLRRKEKLLCDEAVRKLLLSERRGVLAMNGENGYPYAIPINFFYDVSENRIYFHSSRAGQKADLLKKDDRICFTVCGHEEVREEAWAPYLQSAVVFGRCHPVTDPEQKMEKLKQFALKYYPDMETVQAEMDKCGTAAAFYEIVPDHMSGKWIQEK